MRNITALEEYKQILKEIDDELINLELLNGKIIITLSKKFKIDNSMKHLNRSREKINTVMKDKFGHLSTG